MGGYSLGGMRRLAQGREKAGGLLKSGGGGGIKRGEIERGWIGGEIGLFWPTSPFFAFSYGEESTGRKEGRGGEGRDKGNAVELGAGSLC